MIRIQVNLKNSSYASPKEPYRFCIEMSLAWFDATHAHAILHKEELTITDLPLVIDLNLIETSTQYITGGKASNLTVLTNAGFKVPPGFVVTTEAYAKFIAANVMENLARNHLADINHENASELNRATEIMREHIKNSKIPEEVITAITKAYQHLGLGRVAIRSSATAEDLPDASFAGQYDTSLNIEGIEHVLEHIKLCFGSMWTSRAVAYREENEIPHDHVQIAVIVQSMVDARCAGVMFTRNPISNLQSEMMIESNFGLGESVVAGYAVPDRYIVTSATDSQNPFKLVTREIGTKNTIIVRSVSGDGVQYSSVSAEKSQQSSLEDSEILELARIGKSIEELFESPQDIEWAIDREHKFHILQSRPITVVQKKDENESEDVFWTRGYADDYWNDPVTPLFFSLLGDQLIHIVNVEANAILGYKDTPDQLIKLYKGHAYFNLDVIRTKVVNEMPPFIRTDDVLNYFPAGGGPFGKDTMAKLPFALKTRILAEIRLMIFDGDGSMTKTNSVYERWTEDTFNPKCKEFDEKFESLKMEGTEAEFMELADDLDKTMMKHFRMVRYGLPVHTLGMNLITNYLLTRWLGEKAAMVFYPILISGIEHKTSETNRRINELAEHIRQDPYILSLVLDNSSKDILQVIESDSTTSTQEFLTKFQHFLDDFGDRGFTREMYYPRWRESPEYVFDILKSLVSESTKDLSEAEELLARKRVKAEEITEKRIKEQRYGPLKWILFDTIRGMARTYIGFRENQRFNLDCWITRSRNAFLQIGSRLVDRGYLLELKHVFFLYRNELKRIIRGTSKLDKAEVRHLVHERFEDFLKYENITPPKFLQGNREFDDPLPDSAEGYVGMPSSQGIVTGIVRVLGSIEEIPLVRAGEILVVPRTDPGWTPVFSKIGGLVTETGGILSHGAVVSREFGIPAVTNVRNACQLLKTGQKVTLNGNDGIVVIIDSE